jgi:hypothetical protein
MEMDRLKDTFSTIPDKSKVHFRPHMWQKLTPE